MEDKQIGVPTNVAVFIDYENVYKALLEEKTNVLRLAFFEKLRKWCSEHQRRVVRIVVYCNFDNRYSKVMSYELATIIKGFYDDGNIFFYNYKYGTKPCVGFAPISKKADLISKGIIKEADVIATYDIQKDIDDLYAKALR